MTPCDVQGCEHRAVYTTTAKVAGVHGAFTVHVCALHGMHAAPLAGCKPLVGKP